MRQCFVVFFSLIVLSGCGSGDNFSVAKNVSGIVTLNGKPLSKASVTFVPSATKDRMNPGPTAQGITDGEGRFKLNVDPTTSGSVVGNCRIYITTLISEPGAQDRDAGGPISNVQDKLPPKYNMKTELTFDVPPGGTDKANFDLKVP